MIFNKHLMLSGTENSSNKTIRTNLSPHVGLQITLLFKAEAHEENSFR